MHARPRTPRSRLPLRSPAHGSSATRRPAHAIDALRRHRAEVLALWKQEAHVPALAAQLHDVFDHLLERASVIDAGQRMPIIEHPLRKDLLAGHDLGQLARMYASLREVIAHVIDRHSVVQLRTLRAVHQAIDEDLTNLIETHGRHHRRSADRSTAELRFLADATAALSSSLHYDETLDRVARLAVPFLADWCVVDLLEPSGEIRRVSVAHRDLDKTELARTWAQHYPTNIDPDGTVARVIECGEVQLVSEVADEALVAASVDAQHLETLRSLGLQSYLIAPLIARDRTIGALTLVSASAGRTYRGSDVALASELARRAAIAVDNARLYDSARTALAARDRLLAIVSHDLRNPLGAIGIITSLLRERAADDKRTADELEVVEQAVERMKRLIADLVDMSSIDAGKLWIHREPVEVAVLVHDAVASHTALAAQRGISLVDDPDGSARVHADRARIGQVLGNILGNAIKFCRAGDTITVSVQIEHSHAVFAVTDTGPGIAPDDLAHIFEPFWSAREHAREGTGLGLYIGKGIIEAHGGTIRAESELGSGTTVSFTLPLA